MIGIHLFTAKFSAGQGSPDPINKGIRLQLTLRPYVTAGVALAGASVIAISPISPVTSDIHAPTISTHSAAVDLAAAVNPIGDPISAWVTTLTNAAQNLGALGGQVIDNGAPVMTQILANQMSYANLVGAGFDGFRIGIESYLNTQLPFYLEYAKMHLDAGQIGEAFLYAFVWPLTGTVFAMYPLINNLKIPAMMAQNFANVLQAIPAAIQPIGAIAISTLTTAPQAFALQLQAVSDAVNAGDPLSAVNAVLNMPAAMTDAVLTGLFKPYVTAFNTGLVGSLLVDLPRTIAAAIKPPAPPVAPAAVESAPDTLAIGPSVTKSLSAATTPDALPTTADQTLVAAGPAKELASGVTGTVDSITSAATSVIDAVKTVTLKVDPKPAATETPTAVESSADTDSAGDTDNSATAGTGDDATDASKAKADKESKRDARQQARAERQRDRQVAKKESKADKHVAKAQKSSGGKHRAAKSAGGSE